MKVLSVIVPSYNCAAFLDKGIPTFLHPEVLEKLEILIVNDGSSDATPETAEKYCQAYPGSIRLISQENRGHGGALNAGFAAARGKYLKPVDADDWVLTENLPELIHQLENCESDVVLTHYHTVDVSNGEVVNFRSHPEVFGKSMSMEQIVASFRSFYRVMTFHGIAYKTEFYKAHGLQLSEHVFYEDNQYATFPCCHAATVTALDLYLYEYRVGDANQSVALANQIKRLPHLETVMHRMTEEYSRLPEHAGKRYAALKTQGVVLSYLNLTLLAHPDRKLGRQLAAREMDRCKTAAPEIYGHLHRKYQVLSILSRLHVTKSAWDKVLASRLYNRLRGSRED